MSTLFAQLNANNNTMLNPHNKIFLALTLLITSSLFVSAQENNYGNKIISLGLSGTESYSGKTTFIATDAATNQSYELNSVPNNLGSIYGKFITCNKINNNIYMFDVGDGVNTQISVWELQDKTMRQQNKFIVKNKIINQCDFNSKGILYSIEDFNPAKKEAQIVSYNLLNNAALVLNEKKIVFDDKQELKSIDDGDVTITSDNTMYALFSGKNSVLYEVKNFNQPNSLSEAIYINQFPQYCYSIYSADGSIVATGNTLQLKNYYYTYHPSEKTFTKCIDALSEHLFFESAYLYAEEKNNGAPIADLRIIQNNEQAQLQTNKGLFINSKIEILNTQGQIVLTSQENDQSSFSTRTLSNGFYFAKCIDDRGILHTEPFCINR
ncbi:MAG TPA: T9SS type A sorting domain-containing protein [Bacteroidia bacterium]|nr:T9SS type A sorting domain-containing protein [Bacteroidia bacterium]HNU33723.1 T9SS type A sorting domain-containing protein [Bacteroidia bacterium]